MKKSSYFAQQRLRGLLLLLPLATIKVRGGFPIIRHNEIRDVTANLLFEVCNDVKIEPGLQALTGEVLSGASAIGDDGARLDISVNGLWGGRHEKTFIDVRIFNPHAP